MAAHMPMSPIRVHFGPMPRMLRTLVTESLSAEPDIEIVGSADSDSASLVAARAEGASILMTTDPSGMTDPSLGAVVEAKPLTILVLKPDSKSCVAVTLNRREIPLDGESMADLAKAVRKSTSP